MTDTLPDPALLERLLRAIESDAARLPWAKERRWRARSHVRMEGSWLVIDLHDLSVALALRVVDALGEADVGAARLVTGSGRHTGGRSRLRDAVLARVQERGWRAIPLGPARVEVVRDPARLPVGGGVPVVVWLVLALAVLGLIGWWIR